MTNTDLSLDLRKRVLYSSIGLAIVVSAIFISVAFNLSRDLGQSLEFDHSNKMLLQLTKSVKTIISADKINEFSLNEDVKKELIALLDKDVIGFEIWINNKHIKLKNSSFYSQDDGIANAINTKKSSYDFIENESEMLFWVYESSPHDDLSILMVNKTHALDKAISYVSNRLFITAFLTFWLTVWVALFISALVTKRFEQSNERLKYLATHDMLTGLPNRAYLYEHAQSYFNPENVKKTSRFKYTICSLRY